jgi:DNA-binding transcriptional LysR family regulator
MLNLAHLARTDLNLLVLFEAVRAEGHVGRAALQLNLTPSAVSHGLKRLRHLLGDPLFLRTPKGVVPTARALELAGPIAEVLARTQDVLAGSAGFVPATARRRFTLGAPDAISSVVLPPLLADLQQHAPGIDLNVRQLLPSRAMRGGGGYWDTVLADLDQRTIDVALLPLPQVPARFSQRTLYTEQFVIAARRGHAFARRPTAQRFCAAAHVVVSLVGDPHGFVDRALAERGLARRVALTVPNFSMALALVAETDLLAALPSRLVARQAARYGLVAVPPPVPLDSDAVRAIVPKAALADAGIGWLFERLAGLPLESPGPPARRPGRSAGP